MRKQTPMDDATLVLARSITQNSSKQSFYTAKFMVDRGLKEDAFRAYAYLRWVDDHVDEPGAGRQENIAFIGRQKALVEELYARQAVSGMSPEEQIAASLISRDENNDGKLESFIKNMLAIIEFDAHRRGRVVSQEQLTWYSSCLATAVMDGIQHFVGNGHKYPDSENRRLAAIAAHEAHMLRDMKDDLANGYINIPDEYLQTAKVDLLCFDGQALRDWVCQQVSVAKEHFRLGKRYFESTGVLRFNIVGYWYCARFEGFLKQVERDGYVLRPSYNDRGKLPFLMRMAWQVVAVTFPHLSRPPAGARAMGHRSERQT